MEIVKQIAATLLPLGDKLGAFLIPTLILAAAILFLFARYSYKFFKVLVPLAGILLGSVVGANLITPLLVKSFPEISTYFNPAYLVGFVFAGIIALLCIKLLKLAIVITGAACGYLFMSGIVHNLLRATKFVSDILLNTDMDTAIFFSTILTILCIIVTVVLFHFFFKTIYILATSIGGGAAALGLAAVFMFANTPVAESAILIAAGVGGFIGLILGAKQLSYYRYTN